ncbi:MAG TPA: haloacid dehalogenase, partial [Anaerolineales bacterium]|nr:haloacid dehalogenase [Anaerolineales bacterium]
MNRLEEITERTHRAMEANTVARDRALSITRTLIRHASHAIRAVHRHDLDRAGTLLAEARAIRDDALRALRGHPDIEHAGFLHDAQKEFAEASATFALLGEGRLPTPEELRPGATRVMIG